MRTSKHFMYDTSYKSKTSSHWTRTGSDSHLISSHHRKADLPRVNRVLTSVLQRVFKRINSLAYVLSVQGDSIKSTFQRPKRKIMHGLNVGISKARVSSQFGLPGTTVWRHDRKSFGDAQHY